MGPNTAPSPDPPSVACRYGVSEPRDSQEAPTCPDRPVPHLTRGHSYFRLMRLGSAVLCLNHLFTQQTLVDHHLPTRQAPFRLRMIKTWSSPYGIDSPAEKTDDGQASKAKSRAISKSTRNWDCSIQGNVTGSCFRWASLGRWQ